MNLKKVSKKTEYTPEKTNKMNNYEYLNLNYCRKGQTVLAGDSITEMYNHTELFAEYIGRTGLCVYNRGISGDTSDRLLQRLDRNVLNLAPRNVVLLIGTNDFGAGADVDFVFHTIEKIIDRIQGKCKSCNIILEGVYPVNSSLKNQGKRKNKDITALNERLKTLAAAKNIIFIDFTAQLADEKGNLHSKYTYDGMHINAHAYQLITKAVVPLLK